MKKRKKIAIFVIFIDIVIVLGLILFLIKFAVPQNKEIKKDAVEAFKVIETDNVQKTKQEEKIVNEEQKPLEKLADYSVYYYYEADKQERYDIYHNKYPELPADEVVWRVNANLDKPFYGFDVPVSDINDQYVIVNKYCKVSAAQKPELTTADGYLMTPDTAEAYQKMKSDAGELGLSITAASAYRSVSYQEGLYNSYLKRDSRETVDTYSARAGYSEHHTGMAIDFIGSFGSLNDFENTKEYPWVRDNCHKYGFIIRYTTENQWITGYKNEPWHLRFIGIEAATDMKEKGISSFEEYKTKFIDHIP